MRLNAVNGNVKIVVLVFLAVVFGVFVLSYNSIVSKQKNVDNAWADIEAQMQRRLDLIPNLVETVKGYAEYEASTLPKVIEARNKVQNALDSKEVTPAQLMQAKALLDKNITGLFALVEQYPTLRANQNFLALQDQLEGMENRIAVARQRYNYAVKAYNRSLVVFPNILVARMLGFNPRDYFKAEKKAEKATAVRF